MIFFFFSFFFHLPTMAAKKSAPTMTRFVIFIVQTLDCYWICWFFCARRSVDVYCFCLLFCVSRCLSLLVLLWFAIQAYVWLLTIRINVGLLCNAWLLGIRCMLWNLFGLLSTFQYRLEQVNSSLLKLLGSMILICRKECSRNWLNFICVI